MGHNLLPEPIEGLDDPQRAIMELQDKHRGKVSPPVLAPDQDEPQPLDFGD